MRSLIKKLIPPSSWRVPVIVLMGILVGLAIYVLYLSKAASYLSDVSETCVNCHVMAPQYATWNHSSHRRVTNCNDCHVPQENQFRKYFFKGKDGLRHATIFALRLEPQVIFIKKEGRDVVHRNCIRCHVQQITNPKLNVQVTNHHSHRIDRLCWECHRDVPHGRVNSLSSAPYARVPVSESPLPEWIKKILEDVENK